MESLAPSLKCLIEMQSALKNGEPVRVAITRYIQAADPAEQFPAQLRTMLFAWDQGQDWRAHLVQLGSPQRRAIAELIFAGISGQSILPQLNDLKIEIVRTCDGEIKRFVDLLPLKMLLPLLFFQFPAFLLLLFGPILNRFVQELGK